LGKTLLIINLNRNQFRFIGIWKQGKSVKRKIQTREILEKFLKYKCALECVNIGGKRIDLD